MIVLGQAAGGALGSDEENSDEVQPHPASAARPLNANARRTRGIARRRCRRINPANNAVSRGSDALMRAVAERLAAGRLATAQIDIPGLLGDESHRGEA